MRVKREESFHQILQLLSSAIEEYEIPLTVTQKSWKKCNTDSSDHCKIPQLRAKTRNYIPSNTGATKIEKRNRTIDISASKSTLARHKAEEKCLIYEVDELANEKTFVEKRNH